MHRSIFIFSRGLAKGPTVYRAFWARTVVVGATLWSIGWVGLAQAENIGEADVIRLAKARDPQSLAARRGIAVAEAQRAVAALYPNPAIGYTREHFPGRGSVNESEDVLLFTLPIDLSNKRAVRKHLARAQVAAAGARAARTQSQAVERALSLFYTIVSEQQRLAIEKAAVGQLVEVSRVVTRRREEGRASGYEQARIEIETELASSRSRQTFERLSRGIAELTLRLGVEQTQTRIVGSLDPSREERGGQGESAEHQAESYASRPSLRLARDAGNHTLQASKASAKTWIPKVSVSAGARRGLAEETRYGYVAGLTVELPFFSRGQGQSARAEARRDQAQAITHAAEQRARIKGGRAAQLMNTSRDELKRFADATGDRLERLERGATSGYREGRRSILELLDARQLRTSVAIRRLELAFSAKQAELALRAARGEFE